MSNFRKRLRTLRSGLSVRPTSSNAWLHRKIDRGKRLFPILWFILSPQHFQWVSLGQCFSVKMSQTTACSREVLILLFSFVVNILDHCWSAAKHRLESDGFRWSHADSSGVLARGTNCTNVRLASLTASVQRAGLDVHDVVPASGSADVLGYEVSSANSYCGGAGKLVVTYSLSRRNGLFAPSSAVGRWSSSVVTNLSWCSATVELSQSLMQASRLRGHLSRFQGSLGQLSVWSSEHLAGMYVAAFFFGPKKCTVP